MNLSNYFKNNQVEKRDISISDPALAEWFGINTSPIQGINVSESSSLGLTAVYRSVSLIAGTLASLPLKSYRTVGEDTRERVPSFLDEPAGPGSLTPYEWKETIAVHLLLHGNAFLAHIFNGAGAIIGLQPIHPSAVSVELTEAGKLFTVTLKNGTKKEFTPFEMTHIPGMTTDGLRGIAPITVARTALATGMAADKAAAKIYSNGFQIGGNLSLPAGTTEEQAEEYSKKIKAKGAGVENAGEVLLTAGEVKFNPWSMSAEDAQFIESRTFQIDEVARIFGVPKVLLAQDGASTWGSGIAELVRGMQRFTFLPITKRIEERLGTLLGGDFCEFDYAGLLAPSHSEVIQNMKIEIEAGLLTVDEARRLLNRPPMPKDANATIQRTD